VHNERLPALHVAACENTVDGGHEVAVGRNIATLVQPDTEV